MKERTESKEGFRELLVKKIENEFQEDPIFKKLDSFNLKDKLFENLSLLESIDFTKYYSTKEAASFLGEAIKEYRLTNTLSRESLFSYFQVIRKGSANRYLYDWRAIWRFKMVFLLADAGGMKLVELEKFLDYSIEPRNEPKQDDGKTLPANGEKIEVVIVSETLDALKKEIKDSKQSFQAAIIEMKTTVSQKENETLSSLKEVMIQEYTQQEKFLGKIEDQLEEQLKRKRYIKFWFLWWERKGPFEEDVERLCDLVKEEKELVNQKVRQLKKPENNSLVYHPVSRLRCAGRRKL